MMAYHATDTFTLAEFANERADSQNFMVVANEQERFVYNPQPINVEDAELSSEQMEQGEAIAENVHDVWAMKKKDYDRQLAFQKLRLVQKMGYRIVKDE